MGTIWVREFTGGLDTRRLPETTSGGVLIRARDGHITRGGEFEKRGAFVKIYDLPPGTVNLGATANSLITWGHAVANPDIPDAIAYQQLAHPDGTTALERVLSYDLYAGKIYAAARFADGSIYHYYDGARVTSWETQGYARGTFVRTVGKKVYSVAGPNAHFSAVGNATQFDPAGSPTGAGFIDMSAETSGAEALKSIARYQGYLAFFAERVTQIEFVDPDPALNRQVQVLNNTGTFAPKSVTQFGDNDVFYLDRSGLRSLRARDASNAAATTDTGVAVDSLITADIAQLTDDDVQSVIGMIEPRGGRFWLSIKGRIFVFSFYSGAKVSAWSTYEPGFYVDDMLPFNRRAYLRSGDAIYVYGGLGDSIETDNTVAEAWLPYLDADKPTKKKTWKGIDAACQGIWEAYAGMDPVNQDTQDLLGTIAGTTYNLDKIGGAGFGESTHCSLRFRSKGTGPAVLSAAVLHYEGGGDDD